MKTQVILETQMFVPDVRMIHRLVAEILRLHKNGMNIEVNVQGHFVLIYSSFSQINFCA